MPNRNALLVSLHAYPDPAIGAKRVSELANFLDDRRWKVSVAASDGPFSLIGGHLHPSVERISIPVPATYYSRLRKYMPTLRRASHQGIPATTTTPAEVKSYEWSNPFKWIRGIYLSMTLSIDKHKRWSYRLFQILHAHTEHHRPAAIFVSGPPWSPVIACIALGLSRKIPVIVDFRDPWVGKGGMSDPFYTRVQQYLDLILEKWCIARAYTVTCASRRHANSLQARYADWINKIDVIANGYDAAATHIDPPPTGRLEMLFAGTIYFNRNPMPLLKAVAKLVNNPELDRQLIHLTLVGHCTHWRNIDLVDWIADARLSDVISVLPPVSAETVRTLTARSNLLVNFAQGQPDQVPAKLFEQIAARRDILLFAESNSESALCSTGVSIVTRLDDDAQLVYHALIGAYRKHCFDAHSTPLSFTDIDRFSRVASNNRFLQVFESAASDGCR